MLHAHAATWRLDEVGYEHAPMYTPWDQFSEVEVSSWEDGLQSIEDHDWSLPEQDECDKSLIHDTPPIPKLDDALSKPLESVPSIVEQSDNIEAVEIPAMPEVRKATIRNVSQTDQHPHSSSDSFDNGNMGERESSVATKAVLDVPDTATSAAIAPVQDHDRYGYYLFNDVANHEKGPEIPSRPPVQLPTALMDPISDDLLRASETASCAEREHFETPSHATVDDEFTISEHVIVPVTIPLRDVLSKDTYMPGPSQILPMTPSQQATDELYNCSTAASHEPIVEDPKDFWTQDVSISTSVADCLPTPTLTLYRLPLLDTATLTHEAQETTNEEPAHFPVVTTDCLPLLATDSPESNHYNITSGDYDVDPFTNADFQDATVPSGTVNTSISTRPANVFAESNVSGQVSEYDDLSDEMAISIVNGKVATTTSSEADVPTQATTERRNTRVDHVVMANASGGDGRVQQSPPNQPSPVFAEESYNSEPSEPSITPDGQTERLDNDVQGKDQSNDSASPRTDDSMLNDQPSIASDLSIQPIDSSPKHHHAEFETRSANLIMNQNTATHVANADAADVTADIAFTNSKVQPPSRNLELQKAVATNVEKGSHMLAKSDQGVSPSHTVVEAMTTSSPQLVSSSLTVSVIEDAPLPPKDLAASSQDNGLSFSMATLTICSPSTSAPTIGLKRSFNDSNLKAGGKEAPVMKKQKLAPEEPAASETTGIDDTAAEPSVSEATTHSSTKAVVFGDTTKHDNLATVKSFQHDAQNDDVGVAIFNATAGGFVDAPSEPQVDDFATVTTGTSAVGDFADTSVNAPSWDSKICHLENYLVRRVWESHQTLSPGTRRSLKAAYLRAERKREAGKESLHPIITPPKFAGPYIESVERDTRERITTASLSPRIEAPISPPSPVSELRGPRVIFKPLRPPAITHVAADSETLHMATSKPTDLADEMDDSDSDELSEIDEVQLSILFLATNRPINQTVVETKDTAVPQDCPAAMEESTPVSEAPAVGTTEPSPPGSRSTHPLLRELDLGYGRRTTRSDTKTSTNVSASLSSCHGKLEPTPTPVTKKDSAPTQAPGIAPKARTPGRTNKYGFIVNPKRRQTRSSTANPEATPTPKPKAAPKAKTAPKARPRTPANAPPKATANTVPKPAAKPKPTTRAAAKSTSEKQTPTKPEAPPVTPKSTTETDFITRVESGPKTVPAPQVMSEPKTTANTLTPAASLGKRKTRHSVALEEGGRRTATEKGGPVGKRLRGQDAE